MTTINEVTDRLDEAGCHSVELWTDPAYPDLGWTASARRYLRSGERPPEVPIRGVRVEADPMRLSLRVDAVTAGEAVAGLLVVAVVADRLLRERVAS